ncbi:helix-turn-helix domain-containing protein [Streptomyces sp. ADMS]|uniref:helix-turn-helix domain-containing protein n=1 Tax=Streptomyces sp. ADMS TaxID=3071415 RepID=UPI003993BBA5
MGNLFTNPLRQLDSNARHATEVFRREVAGYQVLERDVRSRTEALEYSVWLRRRTVEPGVTRLPEVDDWLRDIGRTLSRGPDLVATPDRYYQHDMDRTRTATALNVHARTLDHRLRRAQELTGIHPGSTRGVRVLSVVVTRSPARG